MISTLKMQKSWNRSFPRRSTVAWVVLALYILIYDVIAMILNDRNKSRGSNVKYETFSDGCWRGVYHPVARWPIWACILIIVKHLAAPNFLHEYDPLKIVGKTIRFIRKRL
jgi:hypothetical protein